MRCKHTDCPGSLEPVRVTRTLCDMRCVRCGYSLNAAIQAARERAAVTRRARAAAERSVWTEPLFD